jgi:hypothetical protein
MNPLIGMLASQLGGPVMALPMLLSAMGNHAATPDGGDAIAQATQEHDGSILDDVMGYVGNAGAANMGSALLGQVLGGGTHNAIADAVSQNTGLDNGAATQLLGILTPLVMGALGKSSQQQGGLDINGIAQMLGGASSGGSNDFMGMAAKMLDADGDGNPMNDVGNIIGKMF